MNHSGRRQAVPWCLAAIMASVLFLGSGRTLSSWTEASVANPQNQARAAEAVILQVTRGTATCRSDAVAGNQSDCTTINTYGGDTAPMWPGVGSSFFYTFTNVGTANASSFVLSLGTCTTQSLAGAPAAPDLCLPNGIVSLTVRCSAGTGYNPAARWTDLYYATGPIPVTGTTLRHTAQNGEFNVGARWTCEIRFQLDGNAPNEVQGAVLAQAAAWVLQA